MMPGSAVSVVRRRRHLRRRRRRRRRRPQSTFSSKYVRNAVLRAVPTLPPFQPAAMRTYGRGRRRHRRTLVKYRTEEKQGEDEDDEEAVEKRITCVAKSYGGGETEKKNRVNVKRRRRLLRVVCRSCRGGGECVQSALTVRRSHRDCTSARRVPPTSYLL